MVRKKIGIFTGYFLPHTGGVERYTDKLANGLIKLGFDVVIVTFNDNDAIKIEKDKNRTIYRLPVLRVAKKRYPIPKLNSEYKQLVTEIKKDKIDLYIVNTRFHLTSLIGARLGKKSNKPVLLIEHGTDHFSVNNRILDLFGAIYEHTLSNMLKKYVSKYYGVSKNCNIWLRHFSIQASGVFYNAVEKEDVKIANNDFINKYPKKEVIVTYAGRLIKEKGVINLIDSFKKLKNQSGIRLVIAGDGELLESIKNKYSTKNIDVLGRLNFREVMSLYKRTDIFVYPSLYPEGLPTSILEAGLMECAIIATPRGGTEEVIVDTDHGIIVDGTVVSLREALESLIDNEEKRMRQAKNVKLRVEKYFEWDAVAKNVADEIKGFE